MVLPAKNASTYIYIRIVVARAVVAGYRLLYGGRSIVCQFHGAIVTEKLSKWVLVLGLDMSSMHGVRSSWAGVRRRG